jgi:hypothetical protein
MKNIFFGTMEGPCMHVVSLEKEKQRYKHKIQARKEARLQQLVAKTTDLRQIAVEEGVKAFGSFAFDLLNN